MVPQSKPNGVYTHFPLAVVLLLLRQMLSQMDVPTRQAYTMALVAPEVRTATASVTSLARSAGSATSPVFADLLLQGPGLLFGFPLIVAGILKSSYDLSLWVIFRRVRLEECLVSGWQEAALHRLAQSYSMAEALPSRQNL